MIVEAYIYLATVVFFLGGYGVGYLVGKITGNRQGLHAGGVLTGKDAERFHRTMKENEKKKGSVDFTEQKIIGDKIVAKYNDKLAIEKWQNDLKKQEEISFIKSQILETESIIEKVKDHPIMSESLKERLKDLKNRLKELKKHRVTLPKTEEKYFLKINEGS